MKKVKKYQRGSKKIKIQGHYTNLEIQTRETKNEQQLSEQTTKHVHKHTRAIRTPDGKGVNSGALEE